MANQERDLVGGELVVCGDRVRIEKGCGAPRLRRGACDFDYWCERDREFALSRAVGAVETCESAMAVMVGGRCKLFGGDAAV